MLKYRPEIDGLRTIAVLSVVIYHAQISFGDSNLLTGGFLGVDIFFVISGYLISTIILREVEARSFSYLAFYERRARRILPALFAVITASIPFAWNMMLPEPLKEYAGSVISSLFFGSNFWFYLEDSYTAEPSMFKPFLHTWSLSVEEQFYLIFPVFLLLIWKYARRHLLTLTLVGVIASLALSEWMSHDRANANFYLLHTRAWELGAGVLLAIFAQQNTNKQSEPSKFINAWMLLGLIFIIAPMIEFDHSTRHPSLVTAIPIIGTCLIIYFGIQNNFASRLLSTKPMVMIGKWSYSIYLWHFPIFVFYRLSWYSESASAAIWWLLIFISVVAGMLSYYLIEQPLRFRERISTKKFCILMSVWFVLLISVFSAMYKSSESSDRLGSIGELLTDNTRKQLFQNHRPCHQRTIPDACFFKNPDNTSGRTFVNIGDSHSQTFSLTMKFFADEMKMNYLQLTQDACPFSLNIFGFKEPGIIGNCHPVAQKQRFDRINEHKNSIVFYSGRFQAYFDGTLFENNQGGKEPGSPSWLSTKRSAEYTPQGLANDVKQSIESLLASGHSVVLVYPVPEVGWHVPKEVQKRLYPFPEEQRLAEFKKLSITTNYDLFKKRAANAYAMYDSIEDHPKLVRVYPDRLFCKNATNKCYTHNKDHLYYYDDDHTSQYGARLIFNDAVKKLRAKGLL